MRFDDYQKLAKETDRLHGDEQDPAVIALLGLSGETGSVHTLYKKRLRDKDQFAGFQDKVKEELGDVLWYVSARASLEDLSLGDIAAANLEKTHSRWLPTGEDDRAGFDDHFPPTERLPKSFVAQFVTLKDAKPNKVEVYVDGEKCGATLNDNAYVSDGYRFHDIFHMTCAAMLGWSPVTRALMHRKRKSQPGTDEVEDGGRAIVTDEALAAVVFNYAIQHKYLDDVQVLDWQILRLCKELTQNFEVSKI